MIKKNPLLGGNPHRGHTVINSTIPQKDCNGKIPALVYNEFEQELFGIEYGQASLTVFIRDGRLHRYTVSRERSTFPEYGDSNEA